MLPEQSRTLRRSCRHRQGRGHDARQVRCGDAEASQHDLHHVIRMRGGPRRRGHPLHRLRNDAGRKIMGGLHVREVEYAGLRTGAQVAQQPAACQRADLRHMGDEGAPAAMRGGPVQIHARRGGQPQRHIRYRGRFRLQGAEHVIFQPFDGGAQQRLGGVEIIVERPARYAGGTDEIVDHRCMRSLGREHPDGGLEDVRTRPAAAVDADARPVIRRGRHPDARRPPASCRRPRCRRGYARHAVRGLPAARPRRRTPAGP